LAVPAASVVAGVAYLQSVCPSVAVAQEPHGRLVHPGALDGGGQGLRFPAYCDVYIFLHRCECCSSFAIVIQEVNTALVRPCS
jgi:hypothetical protein